MALKKYKAEKVYYSITEVAEMLKVNASLLRMWEKEFPDIKPRRTNTGIRIYTMDDINTIKKIHNMLKEQGMTINGAKQMMRKNPDRIDRTNDVIIKLKDIRQRLQDIINELPE